MIGQLFNYNSLAKVISGHSDGGRPWIDSRNNGPDHELGNSDTGIGEELLLSGSWGMITYLRNAEETE